MPVETLEIALSPARGSKIKQNLTLPVMPGVSRAKYLRLHEVLAFAEKVLAFASVVSYQGSSIFALNPAESPAKRGV